MGMNQCGGTIHMQTLPVQSLNSLNDQIAHFMVTRPSSLTDEDEAEAFYPRPGEPLRKSMTLMRHLLMDAQKKTAGVEEGPGSLRKGN
ncbi:unnamed protein product [Boreogadus saida]